MTLYHKTTTTEIHHTDHLTLLRSLPTDSAHLFFADPPYNIGIFCKMPADEYLAWCREWIAEADRVLRANGAVWICHKDPGVLVDLSRMVEGLGRGRRNWVTWDKYNGNAQHKGFLDGYTVLGDLRSFQVMAEYFIYHADEGEWSAQCDRERRFIFEPLRVYLDGEKKRAGFTTRQVAEAFQRKTGSRTVTGMAGHWFSSVQWVLPTLENYQWLRQLFNSTGGDHLRRDYDNLRAEYETIKTEYERQREAYRHLRYTFNNPGRISSVWQIPPAANSPHPTPKPVELLKRIILATSNPGDIIIDPFVGSGTTALAAQMLDRRCICGDIDEAWCEYTRMRLMESSGEFHIRQKNTKPPEVDERQLSLFKEHS